MTRQIPMLFKPAMVRALLGGRKTETRRVLKPPKGYIGMARRSLADLLPVRNYWLDGNHEPGKPVKPSKEIDDLIWVKETHWALGEWVMTGNQTATGQNEARFDRTPSTRVLFSDEIGGATKADHGGRDGLPAEVRFGKLRYIRRPSIFLPKADSRLTLRVTGFNIERLHDIDEAGAIAEGCKAYSHSWWQGFVRCADGSRGVLETGNADGPPPDDFEHAEKQTLTRSAREEYQSLWNSINGLGAWAENPWVEVIRFEVIKKNIAEVAA